MFDKPIQITKGAHTTEIKYGPEHMRYQRIDTSSAGTITTSYLGNVEKIYDSSTGTEEWKRTIAGVVQITQTVNSSGATISESTHYLHYDHLGSVSLITDNMAYAVADFYFDPWGKSRQPAPTVPLNNYGSWQAATPFLKTSHPITSRGFTGHEMLDEVGLIHMNGRMYDSALGRFIQADPIIQDAFRVQSLNRYSYVWNNPLNATDPSGFSKACLDDNVDSCESAKADKEEQKRQNAASGELAESASDETTKKALTERNSSSQTANSVGVGSTSENRRPPGVTGAPNFVDANGVPHYVTTPESGGVRRDNLDEEKFFSNVIQPTLKKLGVNDPDAEVLLLGTAIHESHLTMRDQMGKGPAKGLYQMEPATHDDIWDNYLKYHPKLAAKVKGLLNSNNKLAELRNNDSYATAMAYVHYDRARFRTGQAFPSGTNIQGMAQYWKENYNTSRGKGTVTQFVNDWLNATTKP